MLYGDKKKVDNDAICPINVISKKFKSNYMTKVCPEIGIKIIVTFNIRSYGFFGPMVFYLFGPLVFIYSVVGPCHINTGHNLLLIFCCTKGHPGKMLAC